MGHSAVSISASVIEKPNSVDHFYRRSEITAGKVSNRCYTEVPNSFFISLAPLSKKTAESEEPLKRRQRRSGRYSECLKSKLSPDNKRWWRETLTLPETATGASNSIWLNQLDNKSIALIKTVQSGKDGNTSPETRADTYSNEGSLWCGINAFRISLSLAERISFCLSNDGKYDFQFLISTSKVTLCHLKRPFWHLKIKAAYSWQKWALLNLFSS